MTEKLVETAHIQLALGISMHTVARRMREGRIPPFDRLDRPFGKLRQFWSLSTIRAWRPDVADFITPLLDLKPIERRKTA